MSWVESEMPTKAHVLNIEYSTCGTALKSMEPLGDKIWQAEEGHQSRPVKVSYTCLKPSLAVTISGSTDT